MSDALLRAIGWPATILHGDPCVLDRWAWVRRWLRAPGMRTFDAGAGNGGFAMYAAKRGNETIGLSFSPEEVADAERRAALLKLHDVRFRVGDLRLLDELARELGSFDQILCLEVAEHIHDDAKLLSDLAGMLRPGGRLLLTTPNAGHRGLWSETMSDEEDGGHVRWGYGHEEMARLFADAGLRVIAQEHVSGVVSQRLTSFMRRAQRVHFTLGWVVVLPLRLLQVLDRPLTRLTRWPMLCIAVVGERPMVQPS